MMKKQFGTLMLGAVGAIALILATRTLITSPPVHADDGDGGDNESSKIQQGLAIAPVPLKLTGKNRALVGLGSYIVNAI